MNEKNEKPKTLRVANEHAQADLAGFAVYRDQIVVIDLAGAKTALKSIWASVVSSPHKFINIYGLPRTLAVWGAGERGDGYRQFWAELPAVMAHNCVIAHERLFNPVARTGAVRAFYVIGDSEESLHSRIAQMLNAALDVPIIEQWGAFVFAEMRKGGCVEPLLCGGTVTAGYRITPDEAKLKAILAEGLGAGHIAI